MPSCFYNGNYTLNSTRLCVTNCPSPFFADPITGDCAYFCQPNSNLYADNSSRSCTSCPNVTINSTLFLTYADPSTMTCVFTCPSNPSYYGSNTSNTCVKRCPGLTYGDNSTRFCLAVCFFRVIVKGVMTTTYADNSTNYCVNICPQNSWADNITITCVSICSLGTFADNSTWKCVAMCPSNPISYAFAPNRTCIYACPVPYFSSDVGRFCLNGSCPTTPYYYFRDYQNSQCVLRNWNYI